MNPKTRSKLERAQRLLEEVEAELHQELKDLANRKEKAAIVDAIRYGGVTAARVALDTVE